ncbi:hypothetical protein C8R44DRAFT_885346 [Mycena epipterygia]|nr:hypothetical protein C8R44DRAFT_885346 [Mycena epipterygia]
MLDMHGWWTYRALRSLLVGALSLGGAAAHLAPMLAILENEGSFSPGALSCHGNAHPPHPPPSSLQSSLPRPTFATLVSRLSIPSPEIRPSVRPSRHPWYIALRRAVGAALSSFLTVIHLNRPLAIALHSCSRSRSVPPLISCPHIPSPFLVIPVLRIRITTLTYRLSDSHLSRPLPVPFGRPSIINIGHSSTHAQNQHQHRGRW